MLGEVVIELLKDFILERSPVYLYFIFAPELVLTAICAVVGFGMVCTGDATGLAVMGTFLAYGALCLFKIRKYKRAQAEYRRERGIEVDA